ncbi:hypothetical protein Hdeb2414_s0008g00285371 [Helianthus debilis subsp. tardiflorus]
MLVTFKDNVHARLFVEQSKEVWATMFSEVRVWNGELIPFNRIARLKVLGVPFQLRDDRLYDRIGELYGRIVKPSDFNWEETDNSTGECHVLTTTAKRIEEDITILWRGRPYQIWVVEESLDWNPDFSSNKSVEMSGCRGNSDVRMEENDLEEGEVQLPQVNEDTARNQNPNGTAGDNPGKMDRQNACNGHVASGVKTHAEDVSSPRAPNINHQSSSQDHGAAGVNSGTPQTNSGKNVDNETGPSLQPGPTPQHILRKRTRDLRSPPSIGSTQGPQVKANLGHPQHESKTIDLNCVASSRDQSSSSNDDMPPDVTQVIFPDVDEPSAVPNAAERLT